MQGTNAPSALTSDTVPDVSNTAASHRVDVGAHHVGLLRAQPEVLAAERHDARLGGTARQDGQPVGVQAAARQHVPGPHRLPTAAHVGSVFNESGC